MRRIQNACDVPKLAEFAMATLSLEPGFLNLPLASHTRTSHLPTTPSTPIPFTSFQMMSTSTDLYNSSSNTPPLAFHTILVRYSIPSSLTRPWSGTQQTKPGHFGTNLLYRLVKPKPASATVLPLWVACTNGMNLAGGHHGKTQLSPVTTPKQSPKSIRPKSIFLSKSFSSHASSSHTASS